MTLTLSPTTGTPRDAYLKFLKVLDSVFNRTDGVGGEFLLTQRLAARKARCNPVEHGGAFTWTPPSER